MHFRLLGRLDVETSSGVSVRLPGPVARAVVARLLLARGAVVKRGALIDDVWWDREVKDPVNALQVQIAKLRSAFGSAGESDRLVSRDGGYQLIVTPDDAFDVAEFERAVREGREHLRAGRHEGAERRLREGLALWRGRPLDDFTGSPFDGERTRLEALRLSASEEAADAALELGKSNELVPELTALTHQEPLHEGIRRRLMLALYRSGRHAEALAVYEEGRQLLDAELGAMPSPEIRSVHTQILQHDPSLAHAEPTAAAAAESPSASRGSGNVVRPLGPFIGRTVELDSLRERAERERLVTVVGPGGVGKTRLTLEMCGLLVPERDGVWWVDLAVTDAQGVLAGVSAALGLSDAAVRPDEQPHDQIQRLTAFLGSGRMVLALDNCEHVLDVVPGLVAELLGRCPQLSVIATSREPLGLNGEVLHTLAPMTTSESAELFTIRALMVNPSFSTDDITKRDVVTLVRELEGLPLAIELAVPHVRVLSPREITLRLGDRFALLTKGNRTAPERHQTLRAVLDWSYALLDAREQRVLTQLALHIGGCSLSEAENAGLLPGSGTSDVIHTLTQLVDKSLLLPVSTPDGVRVQMLETVREYARARLEGEGRRTDAQEHFLAWASKLAERAVTGLTSAEQAAWVRRITQEVGNLRAASSLFIESGRAADALLLEARIGYFWYVAGREAEGAERLTQVIAAYDEEVSSGQQGRQEQTEWAFHYAISWITWLNHVLGRHTEAREYGQRNVGRWRHSDSAVLAVVGPGYDAMFALMHVQEGAEGIFVEADSLLVGTTQYWDRGNLQAAWSMYCMHRGDFAAAREHALIGVEASEKAQDAFSRAANLVLCGDAEECSGERSQARAHWTEAAQVFRDVGARGRLASVLLRLAYLDIGKARPDAAEDRVAEAEALAHSLSSVNLKAVASNLRALVALQRQDVEGAASVFRTVRAAHEAPLTRNAVALLGLFCTEDARAGSDSYPLKGDRHSFLEEYAHVRDQLLEPLSRRAVDRLHDDIVLRREGAPGSLTAWLPRRLGDVPSVLHAFV
ncbi:BTAD domain-containing putative transcriptional regulator [Streptomyces nigra]|uniref:BTAD domain-containing putative transcriptional regulator n=1 Tax=Streptomyces nigra TaxID=1827580 RepID=UPI003454E189